jgi:hypothetical protein
MVQFWEAYEALQEPTWASNVGTTFVDTTYHQRWRRVLPFAVGTTTSGTGATTTPAFVSAAGGLGYLKMRPPEDMVRLEWTGRRDGAGGQNAMVAWLDNRGDLYSSDDLDLTWTFAVQLVASTGQGGTGGLAARVVLPAGHVGGGVGGTATSGHTGGVGIGPGASEPVTGPLRTAKPNGNSNGGLPTGWRGWLVGCRVQGGYVRNSVNPPDYDTVVYDLVDGYWLWMRPTGGDPLAEDANLTLVLFATFGTGAAAATRRALCSTTIPNGCAYLDLTAPVSVRIEIQNNGSGDPELKVYVSPWDGGGEQQMFAANLPGTVVQDATSVTVDSAGTVTDADATNQLTGQGTIAFGGYPDRVEQFGTGGTNTISVVEGLNFMEHRDLSSSAVLVRDDFQRVGVSPYLGPSASPTLAIVNRFGHLAPSMECDWPWGNNANVDHFQGVVERRADPNESNATSYDPTAYWTLDPEPGAPPAVASVNNRTEMMSFRPAESAISQNRSITFRPGAQNTANPNYSGVAQAIGISLFGDTSVGYLQSAIVGELLLTTDASGAQTSLIARIGLWTATDFGSQPTITATLSQAIASAPNLLDGSDHELEFTCYHYLDNGEEEGPLLYVLVLDGTSVTWVEANIAAGKEVTILGVEEVVDHTPPKYSGTVEGFYFYSGLPKTDSGGVKLWDPWRVHTWAQGTLANTGTIQPDQMASVVLGGEGVASGQDLHDVLSEAFSITEDTYDESTAHEFDSGHHARVVRWNLPSSSSYGRRAWELWCDALDESDANLVETFWQDHQGTQTPFTWTQDGYEEVTVRFVQDSFGLDMIGPGVYQCRFQLEETF